MAQLAFLVLAGDLLVVGILGLAGKSETSKSKTSKPVAAVCVILALAVVGFAFGVLPNL